MDEDEELDDMELSDKSGELRGLDFSKAKGKILKGAIAQVPDLRGNMLFPRTGLPVR